MKRVVLFVIFYGTISALWGSDAGTEEWEVEEAHLSEKVCPLLRKDSIVKRAVWNSDASRLAMFFIPASDETRYLPHQRHWTVQINAVEEGDAACERPLSAAALNIAWLPSGSKFVLQEQCTRRLTVRDCRSEGIVEQMLYHEDTVLDYVVSPSGRRLLSLANALVEWDISPNQFDWDIAGKFMGELPDYHREKNEIGAMAYDSTENTVAVMDNAGVIKLCIRQEGGSWKIRYLDDGVLRPEYCCCVTDPYDATSDMSLAWSPDGTLLAVSGTARAVWDVRKGERVFYSPEHSDNAHISKDGFGGTLSWSSDQRYLFEKNEDDDCSVAIFDVRMQKLLGIITGPHSRRESCVRSADGTRVALFDRYASTDHVKIAEVPSLESYVRASDVTVDNVTDSSAKEPK